MFKDAQVPSNLHVDIKESEKSSERLLRIVGSNIRYRRKQFGWTQEQLAEASNINDKEVSHIEQGNRNITLETLNKIALALDTSPSKILSDHSI